jgi:hypothetical protein
MRHETPQFDQIFAHLEVVIAGVGQAGLAPVCSIQRVNDGFWLAAGGLSFAAPFATNPLVEPDAVNLPGKYEFKIPTATIDPVLGIPGYRIKITEAVNSILEYVHAVPLRRAAWAEPRTTFPVAGTFGETTGQEILRSGTAAAGAAGSITLDAGAPALVDFFKHALVVIIAGTGLNQSRRITAYSALRVASVDPNWVIAPDATSAFKIVAQGEAAVDEASLVDAIWDEGIAGHATDGTFGDHMRRMLSLRQSNMRVVWDTYASNGQPSHGFAYIYNSKADLDADVTPFPLATGKYEITAAYDGSGRVTSYKSGKLS